MVLILFSLLILVLVAAKEVVGRRHLSVLVMVVQVAALVTETRGREG
jgi:hypothetical protein